MFSCVEDQVLTEAGIAEARVSQHLPGPRVAGSAGDVSRADADRDRVSHAGAKRSLSWAPR